MLIEVHTYPEDNTSDFVNGLRLSIKHHEVISTSEELVLSLLSIRREERTYSHAKAKGIFEMVLCDKQFNVCKVVVNSGLTKSLEDSAPKPGATVKFPAGTFSVLPQDTCSPWAFRALIFANDLSWKQPPDVPSILDALNNARTPAMVECDHTTLFYDGDYVDAVHRSSKLCISESQAEVTHTDYIAYYGEKEGRALERHDVFYDDLHLSIEGNKKVGKDSATGDVHSEVDSDSENFCQPEICECTIKYHYASCVRFTFPLDKVGEQLLFRVGEHQLCASTFSELPAGKKRWCYYWWCALNIYHLKSKSVQLPDCFIALVRQAFPDKRKRYTGYRSTAERLEEHENV